METDIYDNTKLRDIGKENVLSFIQTKIKDKNNFLPFQVSYTLENNETKERELKGLVAACEKLGVTEGTIITFDQKGELIYKGIKVKIIPMYDYFL